jgi:hypothetical protein
MDPSLRLFGGLSLTILATGCVAERVIVREPAPRPIYVPPPPPPSVLGVLIDPPIGQPAPVGCPWAPPPMLVEVPPPPPFEGAVWTGGYWVWRGTWVWAHGRWAAPPQPGYLWRPPYYENRDGLVVFITGHWALAGEVFVPPPPTLRISVEVGAPGVIPGPRPMGPVGVFVPPPPGSRPGLIVPAPIGTPPAVVTSAPPVVNVGMRITNNINNSRTTNITNVTNVTNVTQVVIQAPPSATASGQAVNALVPARAHLAAALPPVVRATAPPVTATMRPVAAYVPARPLAPGSARPQPPRPAEPALRSAPFRDREQPALERFHDRGEVPPARPVAPPRTPEERPVSAEPPRKPAGHPAPKEGKGRPGKEPHPTPRDDRERREKADRD